MTNSTGISEVYLQNKTSTNKIDWPDMSTMKFKGTWKLGVKINAHNA